MARESQKIWSQKSTDMDTESESDKLCMAVGRSRGLGELELRSRSYNFGPQFTGTPIYNYPVRLAPNRSERTVKSNGEINGNITPIYRAPRMNQNMIWLILHNSLLCSNRKTLKSGCLSLLTIRSFSARDELGLSVRVWLGFGLGLSVRAIDSLSVTA
eukprot:sb/3472998/